MGVLERAETVRTETQIDLTEEIGLAAHELLGEIRNISVTHDCPVCFSPQNRPGGCLCQRVGGARVEWIRPMSERIVRVAKEKASWLLKFAVVVALVAMVALKIMSSSAPMESDSSNRTEAVRSALQDVAAAEMTAFRETGAYSTNPVDLRHHGARTASDITVRVVSMDADGFCLEATSYGVESVWRYSSFHAVVEPGHC
ncbi:MAG: hypothetical protein QOG54_431 [Actinomycetota bacterium]|jgi:hypothetical protein|nr:hypothetical protein [Actinomycetota bacterium]